MDLSAHSSVNEFFREVLVEAFRHQQVEASQSAEYYLVNLLAAFAHTQVASDPLGVKLAQAAELNREERIRRLKDVGDTSLYVSGFFADSLNNKLVDVRYYIQIGAQAYRELARDFRTVRHTDARGEVYDELGAKFECFVDCLAEVSERSAITSNTGVVQLYERWQRTKSERVARQLRAAGMLPGKSEVH